MIVKCPNCSTRYSVDAKALGQSGRKVRCASCGHEWIAQAQIDPDQAADKTEDTSPAEESVSPENQAEAPGPEAAFEAAPDSSAATASGDGGTDDPEPEIPENPAPHRAWRDRQEAKARRRRRLMAISAWAGVAASLVLAFALIVLNRDAVASKLPRTASAFAAIGLPANRWGVQLKELKSERTLEGGMPVLHIAGVLYNPGKKPRPVPLVRISLQDVNGKELHAWTVAASTGALAAKGSAAFKTAVKNPPPKAVNLRFSMTGKALEAPKEGTSKTLADGAADH